MTVTLLLTALAFAATDDPPAAPVSFMKDVAPILVQNCIACHNPKKSESKYVMTNFKQLAKGGQQGEGVTLEPGDPDSSYFVELIRPDGVPKMPWKLDPLTNAQIALIERWVQEGARYDGNDPAEDWIALLNKTRPVSVPETYPSAMPITALAFSPDGSQVLASGYHEINAWKREGGEPARRIRGLRERTYDIAYSPDGKWVATASGDPGQFGAATLFKVADDGTPNEPKDLVESTDAVFSVAFSPDGKKLAAAGADRAIRVFEVETGKLLVTIEDHADWILDLAFSPDSTRLASASRDKTSKVFDVEKKESLVTFPAHGEAVYSVAWAPDGKTIATAGQDSQVRLWTPGEEAKQTRAIGGFGGPVFQVLFHPEGKQLVACSADKSIRTVDASNGNTLKKLEGHKDWIYSLALSRDGKTIASGSWDGEVRLWDLAEGKPLGTILAAPGLKVAGQ
ncbi:MAG: c-type cytochrome domain-containing protein [Isosphaeraceae bacterium]